MKPLLFLLSIVLIFSVCGCTAKQTAVGSAQTPALTESPIEAPAQTELPTPAAQTGVQDEISTTDTANPIEYSNEKTAEELITIRYSATQLKNMRENFKNYVGTSFDELSKDFKFECVRYTDTEYYVVLLLDNDKKAFLFFDMDLLLNGIKICGDFISKDDFDFIEIGKTTIDEVCEADPNYNLSPSSSITCTSHIVKEGGILIEYKVIDQLFRVNALCFYENSELLNVDKYDVARGSIPYVLDIDKQ